MNWFTYWVPQILDIIVQNLVVETTSARGILVEYLENFG